MQGAGIMDRGKEIGPDRLFESLGTVFRDLDAVAMRALDGRAALAHMALQPVPGNGHEQEWKIAVSMGGDSRQLRKQVEQERSTRSGQPANEYRPVNRDRLESIAEPIRLDVAEELHLARSSSAQSA